MRIPNPYFKDVPIYGDLVLEEILVQYTYPILSVLKDKKNNRFLCMCYDTRGSQQWLITCISKSKLVDILTNKLTLSTPFKDGSTKKIHAVYSYGNKKDSFYEINSNEIPMENLPIDGEFLDAEDSEWEEYILKLKSDYYSTSAKTKRFMTKHYARTIVLAPTVMASINLRNNQWVSKDTIHIEEQLLCPNPI